MGHLALADLARSSSLWEVLCESPLRRRHKCRKSPFCYKLYFLPQRGKSVTRRALFPGSCFPGGLSCSGACAFPGLLAELFPFETPGRLEVGNVGPRSSHRCRATPARPQDGARLGAGPVRGQSEVRAGVPHAAAALSTCLLASGSGPGPAPTPPASPEGPPSRALHHWQPLRPARGLWPVGPCCPTASAQLVSGLHGPLCPGETLPRLGV